MVVLGDGTETDGEQQPPVRSVERGGAPVGLEAEIPLAFPERDPDVLTDTTELYLMERHAATDGSVTVQVLGWERDGDVVSVEYSLPTGEKRRDRYRWPTPGRYGESDFIGLVRGLGYAPGSAEHIAGEFARARNENGRWRIVTGRETRGTTSDRGDRTDRADRTGENRSGERSADSRTGTGRSVPALSGAVHRYFDGVDPMDIGLVSVLLVFLSVVLPATAAIVAGGLTVPITVLGTLLFGGAVVTLWLSIVVAAT